MDCWGRFPSGLCGQVATLRPFWHGGLADRAHLACGGLAVFLSAGWRGMLYEATWRAGPRSLVNAH